jgi:hypothetical protein
VSSLWNILKALQAIDPKLSDRLYAEWMVKVDDADDEGYYAFQHWVQVYHRDEYNRALAYARLQGWV